MTEDGPPPSKRVKLTRADLEAMSKDELLEKWQEREDLIDSLTSKQSSSLTESGEGQEKAKQKELDHTRRENILMMRLTTKEQEVQEYMNQVGELKQAQNTSTAQLRSMLLDPAINLMFQRMKKEMDGCKEKLEQAQNDLAAWKFTPDSQTGKRLMAKCRMLLQENEELGKVISSGRTAKLEGEIALEKTLVAEMKKSQGEMDEFLIELEEDVEGMQSTIYFLQQQLKEAKEQNVTLQHENKALRAAKAGPSHSPPGPAHPPADSSHSPPGPAHPPADSSHTPPGPAHPPADSSHPSAGSSHLPPDPSHPPADPSHPRASNPPTAISVETDKPGDEQPVTSSPTPTPTPTTPTPTTPTQDVTSGAPAHTATDINTDTDLSDEVNDEPMIDPPTYTPGPASSPAHGHSPTHSHSPTHGHSPTQAHSPTPPPLPAPPTEDHAPITDHAPIPDHTDATSSEGWSPPTSKHSGSPRDDDVSSTGSDAEPSTDEKSAETEDMEV